MGNFAGSTSIRKTEACFLRTFLRIHIRVISDWSLNAVNMPIRPAWDNPWMEEISNASSWGKERPCVGSYIVSIQERQWQVSQKTDFEIGDLLF
jgi:hypothetical protein